MLKGRSSKKTFMDAPSSLQNTISHAGRSFGSLFSYLWHFAKFSNHSQISDIELQLMYAIKYNIKINWAKMIMQQMWHVRDSQSLLPYAVFITKILEHFGVSLDGETKVALNLRESKVDIEVVHKMRFVIDVTP
ncbi:hypothetical protein Lal_00026165 [Lupinus albus]|nr:hypothetical protein Lal_00026165 [Lupinus albus]